MVNVINPTTSPKINFIRWSELKRKIELRVEILELNDQGDYSPVEVILKPDVLTGGIYQLRQVRLCYTTRNIFNFFLVNCLWGKPFRVTNVVF